MTNEATLTVEEAINNDEGLYNLAQTCSSYNEFADLMGESVTPWGTNIRFDSNLLDHDYLDDVVRGANE